MMEGEDSKNESTSLLSGDDDHHGKKEKVEWRYMTTGQKCRSIFSWQRIKIVLILCVFVTAIYLFASQAETPYDEYEMVATSEQHYYVKEKFFFHHLLPSLYFFFLIVNEKAKEKS